MRPRTLPKAVTITSLVAALFLIAGCDSGRDDTAQQEAPPAVSTSDSEQAAVQDQSDAAATAEPAAPSTPSEPAEEATSSAEADAAEAEAEPAAAADSADSSSETTQVAATGDPEAMLKKYNCTSCHAVSRKLVGPAYKEVAAKYQGQAGAADELVEKVKKGGSGVWGAIPMPPNPGVPDADVRAMVDWIVAGAN